MKMIAAQEVKRRGIAALDELLAEGPVQIVKNNRPRYVVISEKEYETLMADLAEARLAASEADLKAGRVHRGSSTTLMAELRKDA